MNKKVYLKYMNIRGDFDKGESQERCEKQLHNGGKKLIYAIS